MSPSDHETASRTADPRTSEGQGATDADEARNRLFGIGLVDDVYPTYAELRRDGGVHPGSIESHFPVPDLYADEAQCSVYTRDAGIDVLRRPEDFSSGSYGRNLDLFIGPSVIGMDEPGHRRMRNLLQGAFSKREMAWWETDIIRPVVDHHLGRIVPEGRADLYRDVANKVPVHTIVSALGLPEADREWFFDQAVLMTSAAAPPEERFAATAAMDEYVAPLVADRRVHPQRDLLSVLVQAEVTDGDDEPGDGSPLDRRPLDDDEVRTFVKLLVIAGSGTTFRAYANLMWALLTHPEQYAEVMADRSLVEAAVEESLRFEQPLTFVTRLATADTRLGAVDVPTGCPVHVSIGSANRDTDEWEEPDHFDIHRDHPERHLAFGWGSHRCLGVHLARAELKVLLNRTMDLLPNLRLDPDVDTPAPGGVGFRMVSPLWVVFDAQR